GLKAAPAFVECYSMSWFHCRFTSRETESKHSFVSGAIRNGSSTSFVGCLKIGRGILLHTLSATSSRRRFTQPLPSLWRYLFSWRPFLYSVGWWQFSEPFLEFLNRYCWE